MFGQKVKHHIEINDPIHKANVESLKNTYNKIYISNNQTTKINLPSNSFFKKETETKKFENLVNICIIIYLKQFKLMILSKK